jgi:uncharacterized cofD-like protein
MTKPAVVAIGGGHGLAVTLRAATGYAGSLTGVVSVADDGGSSGRLRVTTGLPAMGDIRYCLTTLADRDDPDAAAWAAAFEHRFDSGELAGHAMGNLAITALAQELGSFDLAIDSVRRLLRVDAAIVPASSVPVRLVADADGGQVHGQVAVQGSNGIRHIALDPADAPASPAAVGAAERAAQIVVGPGSLYTSVLAALAVPDVRDAVDRSSAPTIYVCNLRPQVPETEGYDVDAHVRALRDHGVEPDVVVCHPEALARGRLTGVEVVEQPVANGTRGHDPALLGAALASLV